MLKITDSFIHDFLSVKLSTVIILCLFILDVVYLMCMKKASVFYIISLPACTNITNINEIVLFCLVVCARAQRLL